MIRRLVSVAVASLALGGAVQAQDADEARVMEILKTTPLIDGHNDLPWALRESHESDPYAVDLATDLDASTDLHTDIPRLKAGGMGGQFWSVYVPAQYKADKAAGKMSVESKDSVAVYRAARAVKGAKEDVAEGEAARFTSSSAGGAGQSQNLFIRNAPSIGCAASRAAMVAAACPVP